MQFKQTKVAHGVFGKTVLLILLILQITVPSAFSAPINYVQGQDAPILDTRLLINSVGTLSVPNGQLVLNEDEVQIKAIPPALFDSRIVLSGVALNAAAQSRAGSQRLRVLVYFYAGAWLDSLGPKPMSEMIQTADGKVISGRIVEGDNKALSLRGSDGKITEIAFRQIANIDSARAYWLDIPILNAHPTSGLGGAVIGQAYTATFEPASTVRGNLAPFSPVAMRPLGDEHGLKNSSFAAYLAADVAAFLAPCIVAPILYSHNLNSQQALVNQYNSSANLQSAQLQSLVNRFGP